MARYTVEPGRQIYLDGLPFISVGREGDTVPAVADEVTHVIADALNQSAWETKWKSPWIGGSRSRRARESTSSPPRRQTNAGFGISFNDQRTIEDWARDHVEDDADDRREWTVTGLVTPDGDITQKGWDKLGDDMGRVETNSLAWMNKTFISASDQGHGGYDGNELVGTVEFDPDNPDHAWLIDLASPSPGRNERIDMVDTSFGDLGKTAFDGISNFGASILGGQIMFYDVKPEDAEAIEATLDRERQRARKPHARRRR